jgi:hypothetical protein
MEVHGLPDLIRLEELIAQLVRRHPLDGVLLALRSVRGQVEPFILATAARFAVRYGQPGPFGQAAGGPITGQEIGRVLHLSSIHALADPGGWDASVPNSLLSVFIRHLGNQAQYDPSWPGKWGRAQILFNELPTELRGRKRVPKFDFSEHFEKISGGSVSEFIDLCYIAYSAAASSNHLGFARDYFEKARLQGMRVPDDERVKSILQRIAADATKHHRLAVEMQQEDRRFAAYDFNPLMEFPLIRPWSDTGLADVGADRMLAPIPELLLYRLSTGVYYHMRHEFNGEFEQYFGHLLEAYTGRILQTFVPAGRLFSEDTIRTTYPTKMGQAPDWVIVDGRTAVLIECKSVRIKRLTYVQGSVTELRKNLRDVIRGLEQLHSFQMAAERKNVGLSFLHGCDKFIPIIVTMEPMHLAHSVPFREVLQSELRENMQTMAWSILSLDELEWLQPHLKHGIDVAEVFRQTLTMKFEGVRAYAHSLTGCTFEQSFLREKEASLCERLGVPRA